MDPDGRFFGLPLAAFVLSAMDIGHRIANGGKGVSTQNASLSIGISGAPAPQFPNPGIGGIGPFYDRWDFWPAPPGESGPDGVPYIGRYVFVEEPTFWELLTRSQSIAEMMEIQYGILRKEGWHALRCHQVLNGPDWALAQKILELTGDFATLGIGGGALSSARRGLVKVGRTGRALKAIRGPVKTLTGKPLRAFVRIETHHLPGLGRVRHLNVGGKGSGLPIHWHIHRGNLFKFWKWGGKI